MLKEGALLDISCMRLKREREKEEEQTAENDVNRATPI